MLEHISKKRTNEATYDKCLSTTELFCRHLDIYIGKKFFFIEYTVVPSHPYQRGKLLGTQRRGEEPLHQSLLQGHGTYWNKKKSILHILLFLDIYLFYGPTTV